MHSFVMTVSFTGDSGGFKRRPLFQGAEFKRNCNKPARCTALISTIYRDRACACKNAVPVGEVVCAVTLDVGSVKALTGLNALCAPLPTDRSSWPPAKISDMILDNDGRR